MTANRHQARGVGAAKTPGSAAQASSSSREESAPAATVLLTGGAYGALVGGGALSVLHLVHNRVDGVRDALAIGIFFVLLAGLAAAAATALGLLAHRVVVRDRNRGAGDRSRDRAARFGADLGWALAVLHLGYFLPFALYGLTYDEVPLLGPPASASNMIVALVLLGVVVAAITLVATRWIARAIAGVAARGALRRWVLRGAVAVLALHVLLPLGFAARARLMPDAATPDTAAYRPLRAADRAGKRVVLVGLDGADWRVLRPMAERGEVPVIARLMQEGAWGPLATIRDVNSATMWASIYTGKTPRQHGVLDFYRTRLPGMSGPGIFPVHRTLFVQTADFLGNRGLLARRIADRSFLRTRPLWEILDDLGASVGVVDGYHYSVPARPLATDGGFFFSYALNALAARPGFDPETLSTADRAVLFEPPEVMRWYAPHARLGDFHWQAATLLDALAAQPQPDFVNLYSHEPDAVQHQRWKWFEPERFVGVDPGDVEQWGDAIPATYRAFDRFLGELIPRLEPGTTLMVVSDHGHSPTLVDRMYTQHRHGPPGIVLLWGDGVRRGVELEGAQLFDVTPTVLHLLGLPAGADMTGRVIDQALDPGVGAARAIKTYDAFGETTFEGSAGPDLSAEEIERLRALGYL